MSTATLDREVGYQHPDVPWNGLTVTDLFCGAGGSSSGLVAAGYKVVIAANHWARAIASHEINHPETKHSDADISQVQPAYFPRTDILWASPECTNHSVAKGVKRQRVENEALFELEGLRPLPDEAANRSRATMWDVPRFAEYHRYKAIIIENVVDAYRWIPFPAWLMAMESLGYEHELVWMNSMHAQAGGLPAPQSRDRMYVVFWLKGQRKGAPNLKKWTSPRAFCEEHGVVSSVQTFKKAERWGRYRAQYVYRCPKCAAIVEPGWLPAASAIDWSIEGTRIGDREKPLSPKTMTRIEKGIERYWRPITVAAAGNTYDGVTTGSDYLRAWPVDGTMPTQTTSAQHGVALPPFLAQFRERERTLDPQREPLTTVVADGAGQGLVTPPLIMTNNHENRARPSSESLPTLTTATAHGLIVRGEGNESPGRPTSDAFGAFTAAGSQFLVVPVEGRDGKVAALGSDPLRTQSTRNETGIVVPLRNHGVAKSTDMPIDTVAANGNHHALLMRNNQGGAEMSTPVHEVMRTLTTGGHQSLLVPYYGTGVAAPVTDPHRAISTVDRYSLVTGPVDVDDCVFRMLTPDEIKVGMAFPRDYLLLGTKREQVKQSGNAVTPPNARDLGYAVAEYLLGVEMELAA